MAKFGEIHRPRRNTPVIADPELRDIVYDPAQPMRKKPKKAQDDGADVRD